MSLGGVVGGVVGGAFNAFLAPVIFKSVLEYPIVLLATALAERPVLFSSPVNAPEYK